MSEQTDKRAVDNEHILESHPLELGLDDYPLRGPSEDPHWAVRTVWIWVCMAVVLLLFIITLLVLGIWYD